MTAKAMRWLPQTAGIREDMTEPRLQSKDKKLHGKWRFLGVQRVKQKIYLQKNVWNRGA